MSKYQGIIRIVDVIGTVFERALTSDEIIDALIKKVDDDEDVKEPGERGEDEVTDGRTPILTEAQFDDVKHARVKGELPEMVAKDLSLPLDKVALAFGYLKYGFYKRQEEKLKEMAS